MSNSKRRRWVMPLRRMITAVFTVGFCFSLIATFNASAAANRFKIQSVKLDKLSETVEGEIAEFNEQNIKTSVVFHNVGDAVKYTITLKNTDSKEHVIQSVTDNNDNPYVVYEYDSYKNTKVNPNDSFDFVVTAKYKTAVMDLTKRAQTPTVKFIIKYKDVSEPDVVPITPGTDTEPEDEPDEPAPLVPDTSGGNTEAIGNAIRNNAAILIVSAIGLIVCLVLTAKKHKNASKLIATVVATISAITVTTSVKAATIDINSITLTSNYVLADKMAVTYVVDGNEEVEAVAYNTAIEKEAPKKNGHTFDGWTLGDGSDFDPETPITEDTVLTAKFTPSSMVVNFNGNGLKFANNKDSNVIEYNQESHEENVPSVAHSSNFNDNGTFKKNGDGDNADYPNDAREKVVITKTGAERLVVSIGYSTESGCDGVLVFEGEYNGEEPYDFYEDYGQLERYDGDDEDGNPLTKETTLEVEGDTVTFFFVSDGSVTGSGYFATIDGYDADDEPISDIITIYENDIVSGKYYEPETDDIQTFYGWSTDPSATQAEYKTLKDVLNNINGEIGVEKTVYAIWDERESFIIKLHGNGLNFENNTDLNTMKYGEVCEDVQVNPIAYSHTSNIDDEGNDEDGYASSQNTKDVVKIPGASSLRITTTYGLESGYDYLYVFKGEYTGSVTSDMDAGQFITYNGAEDDHETDTITIPGNTATFAFYSDSSVTYYGYYAVIQALDADGNPIEGERTVTVCEFDRIAGVYREPETNDSQVFKGWSEDEDAVSADFLNEDDLLSNTTGRVGDTKHYYAVWMRMHKIVYDGNGADDGEMTSQIFEGGKTIQLKDNSYSRDGYYFAGWSEDKNATVATYENQDDYVVPNTDGTTTLYAVWKSKVRVIYDGNGATSGSMSDKYYVPGAMVGWPTNGYTRTGYEFLGWSTNPEDIAPQYTISQYLIVPLDKDEITFYAIWVKQVHIVYDGNGATSGSMSDVYYKPGTKFYISNRYNRSNYDFIGWSTDPNDTVPDYPGTSYYYTVPSDVEEVTLYAIWRKRHQVIFDGNGATSGTMNDRYYTAGNSISLPTNSYERENYMFLGWAKDADSPVAIYLDGGSFPVPTDSAVTTLYAIWAKKYTIHYVGNGSTSGSMSDQVIVAGSTVTLKNNTFVKTDCVFAGWSEDQDATVGTYENQGSFTAPSEPGTTTLYAIWRVKPTVHFDGNGATSGTMNDQVFEFNTAANLRANYFTRTNYTFLGWSTDPDAVVATFLDKASYTVPTDRDEITLYAIWKKKFVIHYDSNGGEEGTMTDQIVEWTSPSTTLKMSTFTKPKYYVDGWNTDKDADEAIYDDGGTFTLPTDGTMEVTLYAIWKPAYTVHFVGGDDVEGEMISYNWDSDEIDGEATTMMKRVGKTGMLIAPNYSKEGYGFAGWSEDPDAASKINNTSNKPIVYGPNENITLTSSFASTATEEGDLDLYAVWLPAETEYTLQTFDKTAFEAAYPNKKVIALRDERDNNVYAVAKIAGGYWWMMENLRLNFADSNTTITAVNTNNPSSTFLNQVRSFKGRTDYQNFFKECTAQNASCFDTVSFSVDNVIRKYNPHYGPTPPLSNINRKPNQSWYSYGVYYNWYTAVAGTLGTYSNNSYEIPADGKPQTASGDICPSGWKLPTGGTYGDYNDMYEALGGTRAQPFDSGVEWYTRNYTSRLGESHVWYEYPVNGVKSGVRSEQGTGGYHNQGTQYWTPSFSSMGSLGTYFSEYYDRYNGSYQDRNVIGGYSEMRANVGFSVRCIAK